MSSNQIMFMSVDFHAQDCHMIATNSHDLISREIDLRTSKVCSQRKYDFIIFDNFIIRFEYYLLN